MRHKPTWTGLGTKTIWSGKNTILDCVIAIIMSLVNIVIGDVTSDGTEGIFESMKHETILF